MQLYRARNPKKSPVWQCVHRHFDEFVEALTYEPCLDVDPMPDYENVLTD